MLTTNAETHSLEVLNLNSGDPSIPRLIRLVVLVAAVLIPLRILGHGYLPVDDALRHAGYAVSGKEWPDILVMRPDMPIDSHPGWHAVLRLVHRATGWGTHALVVFSVVALFALLSVPAVVLMRRPEAWIMSVLVVVVTEPRLFGRMLFGRPFLVTLAAYLTVLFLLPHLQSSPRPPWRVMGLITFALAMAVWIHPVWYLSFLPVIGCVFARWWRAAGRLTLCFAIGVMAGACLTGHPFDFFVQTIQHGRLSVPLDAPADSLSPELRPQSGSASLLLAVCVLLGWRALKGRFSRADVDTPVFWLAAVCWVLGWIALRFWSDWGIPALLVFMALVLQDLLVESLPETSYRRFAAAAAACAVCLVAWSADVDNRWQPQHRKYLALFNPAARVALPDPGGILYSDDMTVFFQGIYRLPNAPWRYLLGFEPGLMPPQDLQLYRAMTDRRNRVPELYEVWVRRMRKEDRMILETTGIHDPPPIPGLEWAFLPPSYWSGRVPAGTSPSLSPDRTPPPAR